MKTNDNNNKNNTLPEYIQGIPTAKNKSRERMDLIRKYYSFLWKKLQKEKGKYIIFNDVVRFANCDDNTTIFFKSKEGTQTENRYKNIAVLYYDFINKNVDYLNFKVKLTIGIRSDNKHIQYCVNKIEVKEKKPTVQSVTN